MTMNFFRQIHFTAVSALAIALCGCAHEHAAETDVHSGGDGHDHSGDIIIDPAMAGRLGVKTERIDKGDFAEVIRATGTIERAASDVAAAPAPVAGTVTLAPGVTAGSRVERGAVIATISTDAVSGGDSEAAARAEAEAADRELQRIESLYADRLVTAAEYSAAKTAAAKARAALSGGAASRKVTAPIAGTVLTVDAPQGVYVSPGQTVATLAADGAMTLRVDVPSRHYRSLASVTDARFAADGTQTVTVSEIGGRRITPGATANAGGGYVSVYFALPASAAVPAGSAADVWLLAAPRQGVVSVPLSALSEQQGQYFVFEAIHPKQGIYRKIPVSVGATDGLRAEITGGLNGGRTVVTQGATAVRLAEMQSVVPEGHSHNH